MNKLNTSIAILFSLTLVACGKGFQATVLEMQLEQSSQANAKAETYMDWHLSQNSPERIAGDLSLKIMSQQASSEEICPSYEKLSLEELALHENVIRAKETAFIFASCSDKLLKKLDDYWDQQIAKSNFPVKRFDQVVKAERDVSQGYKAVFGDLSEGQVALTFDDGPHELYTDMVLKALKDANVKATFFVQGNNSKKFPEKLKAVAKDGHSIGTHTMSHLCIGNRINEKTGKPICEDKNQRPVLSFNEAVMEIAKGHQAVQNILGWVHPFFRFPFGEKSPELREFLNQAGTGEFGWSIDSDDWRSWKDGAMTKPYRANDMVEKTMEQVRRWKKGIILNHDVQKKTAVALPALLNRLHEEGYQPVVFIPQDVNSVRDSSLLREASKITF